jgi:hypothetical protein
VNLSNIVFTKEEQELLDLGLQYNIQQPLKSCWINLIIEIEQAIRLLDTKLEDAFCLMATKKLKQIQNTNLNSNYIHKRQRHIARNIHYKISTNNAIITQADKGKTTVIIYKQDYQDKVHTLLSDNNIRILPNNPTNKDQSQIMKTLKQRNLILHKNQIRHWTQKTLIHPH